MTSAPASRFRWRLFQDVMIVAVLVSGCTIVPLEEGAKPRPTAEPAYELPPLPDGGSSFDVEPELIGMNDPQYPDSAREAGLQGTVFCDVLVDEKGFVREIRVARSVTPSLDQAAVAAARTARYKPAQKRGVPVVTWARIPLEFMLHE